LSWTRTIELDLVLERQRRLEVGAINERVALSSLGKGCCVQIVLCIHTRSSHFVLYT
jgi:hypothetical protein